MKLILASSSPRRREILTWAGVPFTVCVSDADESLKQGTSPTDAVVILAERKAAAVLSAHPELRNEPDTVVLAADTVVDVDGEIFGKPHSPEEAAKMLRRISGREHRVHTGIALFRQGKAVSCSETSRVRIDALTEEDIAWYTSVKEPYDKAGAYAVQGLFSRYVSAIVGDYFNVMGLPVHALSVLLRTGFGLSFRSFTES